MTTPEPPIPLPMSRHGVPKYFKNIITNFFFNCAAVNPEKDQKSIQQLSAHYALDRAALNKELKSQYGKSLEDMPSADKQNTVVL